jgi:pilus assembly protein Flp/PilA
MRDFRPGNCDIDISPHDILTRGTTEECLRSLPMIQYLRNFTKNEDGATAIEYGLIAAGIALAIFAAVSLLKDSL